MLYSVPRTPIPTFTLSLNCEPEGPSRPVGA